MGPAYDAAMVRAISMSALSRSLNWVTEETVSPFKNSFIRESQWPPWDVGEGWQAAPYSPLPAGKTLLSRHFFKDEGALGRFLERDKGAFWLRIPKFF